MTDLVRDPVDPRVGARPAAADSRDDLATIPRAGRLRGEVRLPGDKSISHRALMLALLGSGESRIRGAGDGADVRSTAAIVRALGAEVERVAEDGWTVEYRVRSPGPDGLRQPVASLDCGNSGTTLRLFAGILAGLPMTAVLDGDASLRGRPVARIIEPLRSMGAVLQGRRQDTLPPVTVVGRTPLRAVDWSTPVPSAQVKSAILLAGLRADGTTRVHEAVATRDHTERMLRARGVTVRSTPGPAGGGTIEIDGGVTVQTMDERVPADPSAAAFWLVAGAIHPAAELELRNVGVNPTRRGALDLLRAMGASIEETAVAGGAGDAPSEPAADLIVRSTELHGIDIGPADTARAIDEIPILCLAATQASGVTTIRGAGELRAKESDRLTGIVAGLRALGADIGIDGDDIRIVGPSALRGARLSSQDDHRLAMTFAIAGLVAAGETAIEGASSVAISDPRFLGELERIRS
jgi:3-phosphoshikimate 1-carboxyvinyltransferase